MRGTLTHLATIEHFQETGETQDDGMGGERSVKDWVPVLEDIPCRYEPAGQGYVREESGGRVYSEPRVHCQPWTVGEIVEEVTDETTTGSSYGAEDSSYSIRYGGTSTESQKVFQLDFRCGDNWRFAAQGVPGTFVLTDHKIHTASFGRPSHVTIELERVDATDPEDS